MNPNRILHISLGLIFLTLTGGFLGAQTVPVSRFGLFIGCNRGDGSRPDLIYATTDAENMAGLMGDIGGIDSSGMTLLLNPGQKTINNAFRELSTRIKNRKESATRVEIVFYYSGHADEEGLLIGRETIRYPELRQMLKDLGADVTVAIIDSCSSGAITRLKGGKRVSPFLIDDSSKMEGHAYLTSSSATEVSQESDAIRGSFFTYYLMTGLRGAADASGDGRVTLNELYQHTYQETLYRTEKTMGGPQHPTYEIRLTGTGDLVMSDISKPSCSVLIGPDIGGRLFIRNERGQLVAELEKIPGLPLLLALEEGNYTLTVKGVDNQAFSTRLRLQNDERKTLALKDFSASTIELTRLRGENSDDPEAPPVEPLPFSLSLFPGLTFPASAENDPVIITLGVCAVSGSVPGGVQFSAIGNTSRGVMSGVQSSGIYNTSNGTLSGLQFSGIFNSATGEGHFAGQFTGIVNILKGSGKAFQSSGIGNTAGDLTGAQMTGIFNTAGNLIGIQSSGVFNTSKEMTGLQTAGIFNTSENGTGLQAAGLFNYAEDFTGVQASGLFNVARHFKGFQTAGLFNVADHAEGVLLAPVNIARQMDALPLGLVNISRNGIVDPAIWIDTNTTAWISLRSGNERFFTLIAMGSNLLLMKDNHTIDDLRLEWNCGLGVRFYPLPKLFLDVAAGFKSVILIEEREGLVDAYWEWDQSSHTAEFYGIPNLMLIAGWEFNRSLAIEAGISVDLRTPLHNDNTFKGNTTGITFGGDGESLWGLYPAAFAGIRF